jgi:hypothetical protein
MSTLRVRTRESMSFRSVLAAACLLCAGVATAAAQSPAADWLWAAQTGPNLVTLTWQGVPGAAEYQIYVGDPSAPGTFLPRPVSRLGANSRRASLTSMARVTNGIKLVAVDASQRVVREAEFNRITPATTFAPPTPPTAVTAQATGPSEITVTWASVPGASGYMIGRAVPPSGFIMRCALCPTVPRFVDRDISPGLPHKYLVAAIFPSGKVSTRVVSAAVTPGTTQVASAPAAIPSGNPGAVTTTTTTTTAANTPSGNPGATTTATATPTTSPPPGVPAGATPAPAMPPGTPQLATDSVPARINPQIPATVVSTAPPPIGPTPSDADSLATPPADTGPCVTTASNVGSADYWQGKCLNPGATGYPALWDPVASAAGMTSAELVAAWKEIGIVALEYKHILNRAPTAAETRRDVAALKAGTTWQQLWRQLAHSAERDTRFGYWAAAPIPDSLQAQRDFGLAVPPWTAQTCSGGLGPRCDGGIPDWVNDQVQPAWFGAFRMPDNTELAYVEMGIAVGSVLHDNACLMYKDGLNCNGMGAGDLVKNLPTPITGAPMYGAASLEWNKAAWNVLDKRTWRARFGPYPTDPGMRNRNWYDDLRPVAARPAMMAPAVSMFTWPGLTQQYTGGESRQSRALLAPAGTPLDATDVAFCRSGAFGSTGSFIGKAPWGICAQGTSSTNTQIPSTHTASPPTTGSLTCKLDYQRADNMWAAFGRPDGLLGTESITLAAGDNKVFVTDWKYEKQRNDGSTYYGSHLRLATNLSSRAVRLQVISNAGTVTSSVRLDPNTSMQFQADLRDVYCEP